MTLDLTGKLRPTDRKLRIESNMELYWDCIFLAQHLPGARLALKTSPVRSAIYTRSATRANTLPTGGKPTLLDYDNVDQSTGWKLMDGDYTRYGEVGELLAEADDCYVIMAHGDEVTLRFPVKAFGPVPRDCCRTFLLKTDSYCKDMDLHTCAPGRDRTAPVPCDERLPLHRGRTLPGDRKDPLYCARYNTRKIRSAESQP